LFALLSDEMNRTREEKEKKIGERVREGEGREENSAFV
jgi:hypothetical protein